MENGNATPVYIIGQFNYYFSRAYKMPELLKIVRSELSVDPIRPEEIL